MGFRTLSLVYSTVINCILTFFGTIYFGYFAAAIGTAASTLIGSAISMSIYYRVKLDMRPLRMLWNIMKKALPGMIAAGCIAYFVKAPLYALLGQREFVAFLALALVFLVVYILVLLPFYKKDLKRFFGRA